MQRTQGLETQSICASLNLRVEDLNDPYLSDNAIYRRLCNIVANDRNKSDYHYRKNLVKELYFLLKITPIMKPELRESYLAKLELWYNKNDHKKTELGSGRLKGIVDGYVTNKNNDGQNSNNNKEEEDTMQRPQSGVMWNKNVVPFLRPYTAQRQQSPQSRPQSYKSKYGRSTKASTQLQQSRLTHIKDFALSIRQQLQMSQDFITKSRTAHPQQQPIYQQLYSIIRRAGIKGTFGRNQFEDDENEVIFQRDKQEFMNSPLMNNDNNVENSNGMGEVGAIDEQQDEAEILNVQDFGKVSQQSEKQQDEQQQEQQKFIPQQKSPFIKQKKAFVNDRDRRISQNKNIKPVQGFLKLQQQNHYDTMLLKKLNNKYTHVTNNKFVNSSKDDHEIVRDYVEYSRVKSAMRREMSRKSQSARLMSAKGSREMGSNFTAGGGKNPRVYSALPRRRNNDDLQIGDVSANDAKKEPRFFDLTKPQTSFSLSATNNKPLSHYNQRKQLDKIYRTPIQDYKKLNKASLSTAQLKCKNKSFLTRYDTFLTREKINPIADVHIQEHNKEALDQIEKIKSKVAGLSHKCASTESLMKALYIDSYDDVGSCAINDGFVIHGTTINLMQEKKNDDPLDWRNKNLYFNMLSNGQKKLKKKKRLLKKKK